MEEQRDLLRRIVEKESQVSNKKDFNIFDAAESESDKEPSKK